MFDARGEDTPERARVREVVRASQRGGRPRRMAAPVWGAAIDAHGNVLAFRSGATINATLNMILTALSTRYDVELDPV